MGEEINSGLSHAVHMCMPKPRPSSDPAALRIAFDLIFRKGRAPPSCPMPDERDLLNRIMDRAPEASAAGCRDALIMVRKLSYDVYPVCDAFREGLYGTGEDAKGAAIRDLEEKNPGFTDDEYLTAFAVGMMWTAL